MIRELAHRGAWIQSCTGSVDGGTESKAKPGRARRGRDTPAPSFCCCLTWFLPQTAAKGKSLLLLCCKSLPPPPRAHYTSTFQHGNPGAAIAEVESSPGGIEPELCLLLLAAGWTGPQGHLRVGLWARRGARRVPLRAHNGGAVRLIPMPTEGWTSQSHPDDGHQGTGEMASRP